MCHGNSRVSIPQDFLSSEKEESNPVGESIPYISSKCEPQVISSNEDGDEGSGGCILHLLGVLILICSYVGLVGVTIYFFIRVTMFLFP